MTRDPAAQDTTAGAAEGQLDMRELRLQRNLKIVVAFLGFLILAGLSAVVIRVLQLASTGAKIGATTTAVQSGAPRDIALELPKDARIISTSVGGNRLAVHYESPTGTGIVLIDIETGQRLAVIRPQDALPTR
jgi:hypothetical protein